MRIYLDTNCLRAANATVIPKEDSADVRALRVAAALIYAGAVELVSSFALASETAEYLHAGRRKQQRDVLRLASLYIERTKQIDRRVLALRNSGLDRQDALHIACAESSGANWFVTRDRELVAIANRPAKTFNVRVVLPAQWLEEAFHGSN